MKNINLTIKQKLVLGIVIAVLTSTLLVGYIAQSKSYEVVEDRLVNVELPSMVMQIRNEVDKQVTQLSSAAEQLAKSRFILSLYKNEVLSNHDEQQLVQQLNDIKTQYSLNDASVANRETGDYWNQNGFLRRLTPQQDEWFFGFTKTSNEKMLNVFQESTGEVKLFVNYQQLNGKGMSGLSKSLDDMVRLLNTFKVEETGFVYLADAQGTVQLHRNNNLMGKSSFNSLYGNEAQAKLTSKQDFNLVELELNGQTTLVATSYIESMDWFVVAEAPKDEAFAQLRSAISQMVLWTAIIAIVLISLAFVIAGTITRPLHNLACMFRELGEGEGDLSHRLNVEGNDEIAQLSSGFNSFIAKIHHSVKEVAETGNSLRNAAETVATKAQSTLDNSQQQRDQTIQVVTAINQMGMTISEIAANAAQAAETAHGAESDTTNGQNVVNQAKESISQLASDMNNVSNVINNLANNTQEIGSILDVIRGISEQTNLLALNAAIEAARAGEQGRGFAVVADEVRNLASRTADSTDEIQKMINQLQTEAKNAVTAMEASQVLTSKGVSSSDEAAGALSAIASGITTISDMNTQVATATEEQSTVVHTINSNIEEINDINQLTTGTAEQLALASLELKELSQRLDTMVGTFRL